MSGEKLPAPVLTVFAYRRLEMELDVGALPAAGVKVRLEMVQVGTAVATEADKWRLCGEFDSARFKLEFDARDIGTWANLRACFVDVAGAKGAYSEALLFAVPK